MDTTKRARLIESLSQQPAPQLVTIEQFFDGNDDLASIGCNLLDHPGIDAFRDTLLEIARRPDVEATYAQIAELDPGDDCWPFTDTIFIAGAVPVATLRQALAHLQPDSVDLAESSTVPGLIRQRHSAPVVIVWWD
jgi:hypothetical protein